jgi:protein O-GlcNAc transferase
VPNSRLVIKFKGLDDADAQARLRAAFAAQGIAPERLDISGGAARAAYLGTYNVVDIALDTFLTAAACPPAKRCGWDVRWWPSRGPTFAGRHAAAYLRNAGLAERVAADRAGTADLAVALAGDLPRLSDLRLTLRQRLAASRICDGAAFAADFTAAMRSIWAEWCGRAQPLSGNRSSD